MTTDPTPEPAADPIGRELMRHAQLISQLRHDLEELAHGTTDLATDLLARVEELNVRSMSTKTTRSWCWRDLGPQAQEQLWSELREWVGWLRERYPLAKKLPACWPEHPEIVEELTALWLAWQQAYTDAEAPLTAPADWHDRWLPGLLHRLQNGPHALECSETHRPRPARAYAQIDSGPPAEQSRTARKHKAR